MSTTPSVFQDNKRKRQEPVLKQQYLQRIDALFADIERLASDPNVAFQKYNHELEALKERVRELEEQIAQIEVITDLQPDRRPAAPVLYEKESVGYVYAGNNVQAMQDEVPENINLDQAIDTPLIARGKAIGKMQIEFPADRKCTPDEENLIEAVARQVSQQIQNLSLLETAERARAEAESVTRRFIHENWASYLDAIHQHERVGYAYNRASVFPCTELPPTDGIVEAVKVMDEQIGIIYVEQDTSRDLSAEDRSMISTIAERISLQVENIRLLADASRARAEAEEATRRLTHDSWQTYSDQQTDETALGFVYDGNQVVPLNGIPHPETLISQPLRVRGEVIGQLSFAGLNNLPPDALDLASAIATNTSIHLETLRLTEELQKRAAELQELDRLKTAFLANMSHELRTPLNSILGFTDVIIEGIDGPVTDQMGHDLQLVKKNSLHLLHLINDVLDMAKIEAGRMNLVPEKFKLYEIIEEVTNISSTLVIEKYLSLFIDEESDRSIEVFADRTRIRQVLLNLVTNAIKFTERGTISILSKRQDDHVVIKIKDTGSGIPPEKLEDIFQEFTQVDVSATRKVGGTGLGLPISRRLIELHGGRLWAESSGIPGEGSTFFVDLPIEAKIQE